MATIKIRPSQFLSSSKLRLLPNPNPSFKSFCTLTIPPLKSRAPSKARARVGAPELKENWLDSLSCPFPSPGSDSSGIKEKDEGSVGKWVVGIDPDVSGALALLKDDDAQVFDSPHLQVLVGNKVRKRLDVRSIVQLLRSFGAPLGTKAFIEQSTPYPQDGKQGWWSGGFTYGLWIGILVSSGFSVVPVSSRLWKDQFQLYRSSSSKDDSRKAASDLFPSLSSSLKRKKDHGRAEALLIAAYGKGLRIQAKAIGTSSEASTPTLPLENCSIEEHQSV